MPLEGTDGLTAIVARTGAPARIEDYGDVRGQAAELMAPTATGPPSAAPSWPGGRTWGLVLVASVQSLGL